MVNHWDIFLSIYNFDWLFTFVINNITQIVYGSNKQGHVIVFVLVWHVELGYSTFLPLTTTMKAISAAQHSSVISLLNEGCSLHQVQDRTGLGKSTVGRISKEVLGDKENCPRGCPSKLSSHD